MATLKESFKPGTCFKQPYYKDIIVLETTVGPLGTNFILTTWGANSSRLWTPERLAEETASYGINTILPSRGTFAEKLADRIGTGAESGWFDEFLQPLSLEDTGEAIAMIDSLVPNTTVTKLLKDYDTGCKKAYDIAKQKLSGGNAYGPINDYDIQPGQAYKMQDEGRLLVYDVFDIDREREQAMPVALVRWWHEGVSSQYTIDYVDSLCDQLADDNAELLNNATHSPLPFASVVKFLYERAEKAHVQTISADLLEYIVDEEDLAAIALLIRKSVPDPTEFDRYILKYYSEDGYDDFIAEYKLGMSQQQGAKKPLDKSSSTVLDSGSKTKTPTTTAAATVALAAKKSSELAASPSPTTNMASTSTQTKKEEKKTNMASTSKSDKNNKIIGSIKQGARVSLADEAGTVVLEFVNEASGGKLTPYMATPDGAALVKLVAATLLLHGVDFVTEDAETRANVEVGCSLLIEASSRAVLQPRLAELRKVGLGLARVGMKSRELPSSNS